MTPTETRPPTATIAVLRNVKALMVLTETLAHRPAGLPGLGVMAGPSGYGKSVAAGYVQNRRGAIYLEFRHYWTQKTFCESLLKELGVKKPRGTIATMMEEIIARLADVPDRPLLLDEADKLCDKRSIELVRDLYETTGVPVILIGEEQLPAKLAQFERVAGRVLDWVYAEPSDLEDCRALAEIVCPGIAIDDQLLATIVSGTNGSARRIATTLHEVRQYAAREGVDIVSADAYRGRIFDGEVPRRSKRAGR